MARILFLMARRLNSFGSTSIGIGGDEALGEMEVGVSSSSSSLEQVFRMAMSMSVIFSPTNGRDHVKTSMKLGNQYG